MTIKPFTIRMIAEYPTKNRVKKGLWRWIPAPDDIIQVLTKYA